MSLFVINSAESELLNPQMCCYWLLISPKILIK